MVMGCIIIQEVKGLMKLFYCPGGRPASMQNFRFIVQIIYLFLHGCGLHCQDYQLKGLTTNYIRVTIHYPGRKPVYLQIFGAMVSEFRFFMKIKNIRLITPELKGLTKKLSFSIPPRYKV